MSRPKRLFISAGEVSGDVLGASFVEALKKQAPFPIEIKGIAGPQMQEAGVSSLFPMSDLSVMGLGEVIPHLPRLIYRLYQTASFIKKWKPDLILTIDAPDFHFRLQKRLRAWGENQDPRPIQVHYTAPTVWAWRPGRAKKIARFLDHLLALFPFEPPYFEKEGLATTFVGHPIVSKGIENSDVVAFRKKYDLKKDHPLLCLLPGSRQGEIARLFPVFQEVIGRLKQDMPDLRVVIPIAPGRQSQIQSLLSPESSPPIFVETETEKYQAMCASQAALAASGTTSLELGMAACPAVIAYKMTPITAWIARRVIKTPHFGLVNILSQKRIMPELFQGECTVESILSHLKPLLTQTLEREAQVVALEKARRSLSSSISEMPSAYAARSVLALLG
ncbi:MAG: lipid-A-disaccharide synthase [bacterium]|nr:lipid-A-disaccharide synthase [bacterium]